MGAPLSNYDGEVAAIHAAAVELESQGSPAKAVLLVDSQSAIHSLSSNSRTDCKRTIECRKTLSFLLSIGWTLKFQWIPSHVNIGGNEMADKLAKEGAILPQPRQLSSLRSARVQIKTALKTWNSQRLKDLSYGKQWESLVTDGPLDEKLPRSVSVAAFRIKTGHDCLAAHLHRIHILPSPECQLCGHQIMNADHLYLCPALNYHATIDDSNSLFSIAQLYWSARHLMAQRPKVGVG